MRNRPRRKGDRPIDFLKCKIVIFFILIFLFGVNWQKEVWLGIGVELIISFPLQRDSGGGAARNRNF